jgi:hypothetical protein
MSRGAILPVLAAAALLAGGGCYRDDAAPTSVVRDRKALTRVLLTDAPFPYDRVASLNIHVVRIDVSADLDTSWSVRWELIAEPRKSFNLLELQQGATAFVGEGELPAGRYHLIRMTIDTSLSSIVWNTGGKARINWQNYSASREMPLHAFVQYPVDVRTEGADIVLDFDVGRSFLYEFYATNEFALQPRLRAINSAATGAIVGTVTSDYTGERRPVKNAGITVYAEACTASQSAPPDPSCVVSSGRSDAVGNYKVAFVPAGTYHVWIEQPDIPLLDPVVTANVRVTAKATTTVSATLPAAGSSGGAYVRISGPASVGVGGTITLLAAVGDASGNPVPHPSVTWTSSDAAIATVTGTSDSASVTGRQAGFATIYASSGGLTDSQTVQVVGSAGPVAAVSIVPASATVIVGDTGVLLSVELHDSAGSVIYHRGASWFTPDSSVLELLPCGMCSQDRVYGRAAGVGIVYATSEGKIGRATITVR